KEGSSSLEPRPAVEELQTLDAPRASKIVSRALVVLDLRSEDDRPLREERGVIVDSSGVVLCRFQPLLGAHHGICRLSSPQEARVEISGLVHREKALDLALVRIASSPVGYSMVPLLADPPSQVLQPSDPLFLFSDDRALEATVSESY